MKTKLLASLLGLACTVHAQISGTFAGDQTFTQRISLGGDLTIQGSANFPAGIETATGYTPCGVTVNGNATIAGVAGPEFRRLKHIIVSGKLDLACDATATGTLSVGSALQLNAGAAKVSAASITINGDLILAAGQQFRLETTGGSIAILGKIRGPATGRAQLEVSVNGGFFRFDGVKDSNVDLASSSSPVSPAVVLNRLANLSMMLPLGTQPATVGFVVVGDGSKKILVRAIGPGLAQFNVGGGMEDPKLAVFQGRGSVTVNDWGENPATVDAVRKATTSSGAFNLPEGSKDAAVVIETTAGSFTAQISSNNGKGGTVLIEVYEVP